MFCVLLCAGQLGMVTRGDTGEAQENKSLLYLALKRGVSPHGTQGKAPGFGQQAEVRSKGKSVGQGLYWDFFKKGKAGQSKHLRSG